MTNLFRESPAVEAGKRPAADRPLIGTAQTGELIGLFKMLANPTRLRIVHVLARSEELSVSEMADELGLSAQAVSNQLQRLTDRGVLTARREGTRIFYRVADPCVVGLLDLGLCLLEETDRLSE